MKALYELVEARDLKRGDMVIRLQDGVDYAPRPILGICPTDVGNVRIRWAINCENTYLPASPFFRLIPAADDPRALRRALEIAAVSEKDPEIETVSGQVAFWIEQARQELESEA